MKFVASGVIAIFLSPYSPAMAAPAYDSAAPIAYMIDMSSGAVLYDKGSEKSIAPASMTKMLSAYVMFDRLAAGRTKLDQKYKLSRKAWDKWHGVGSTMFLNAMQPVAVQDLLQGMITVSGNDAAIALAEGASGTEASFIKQMNDTAYRLGMKNSKFASVNGWPDGGKTYSTARDLALLSRRTIQNYPDYFHRFYGVEQFRWGNVTQADRNPILGKIAGADGLKTGHTDEAGYCFAGTAIQGGRRILMVVAGLPTYQSRIDESVRFMKWGFEEWATQPLYKGGIKVGYAKVQLGDASTIPLLTAQPVRITIPNGGKVHFRRFIRYIGPLRAPIAKKAHIADLVVKLADGSEQVTPLIAGHQVGTAGFFGRAWNGVKSVVGI
jgi:serine-type D-Ala-D-Ala carboxypeptidase (penicillin-binding protein 5/6)